MNSNVLRELVVNDLERIFAEANLFRNVRWSTSTPQEGAGGKWRFGVTGSMNFDNFPGGIDLTLPLTAEVENDIVKRFVVNRAVLNTKVGTQADVRVPDIFISSDEDKRLKKCLRKGIDSKVFRESVDEVIEEIHTRVIKSIFAQGAQISSSNQ